MKKKTPIACLLFAMVFATSAFAQHQHPAPQFTNQIDGSKNPELISDAAAYRLLFLAISPDNLNNPSPEDNGRLSSFLAAGGLKPVEIQAVAPVITNFRKRYAEAINTFNANVAKANASGGHIDLTSFRPVRDALVESTRAEIVRAISPQSAASLHAFVQSEKKNMRVAKEN